MDQNDFREGHRIAALVADLMFAARVRGAAPDAVTVHSADRLLDAVGRATRLVLIDAHARGATAAVADVRERAPDATIVAFGSHVDTEALQAVRDAGAHRVLARSGFVRELPGLVDSARGGD